MTPQAVGLRSHDYFDFLLSYGDSGLVVGCGFCLLSGITGAEEKNDCVSLSNCVRVR